MTRKSERELERAVEDLQAAAGVDTGDPLEIEITDTVVATDATIDGEAASDIAPGDVVERRRTRVWRDDIGEWHSDVVDIEGGNR
jgi:hypothetical protein